MNRGSDSRGVGPDVLRQCHADRASAERTAKGTAPVDWEVEEWATHGWHVYEETLRRHRGRLTQKEIDVAIAVDLMSHTQRKNTDLMALVAGDLDFRPVVDAVVRDGMYLRLIHGPMASQDLKDAADARLEITPYLNQHDLANNLHPRPRDVSSLRFSGFTRKLNSRRRALAWPRPDESWSVTAGARPFAADATEPRALGEVGAIERPASEYRNRFRPLYPVELPIGDDGTGR